MQNELFLFEVENHFLGWGPEPVQFNNSPARPEAASWINVKVEAMGMMYDSLGSCDVDSHMIYVTCYAANRVQAARLADRAALFTENKHLGSLSTGKAQPVHQADVDDEIYFYRIKIPIHN